MDNRIVSLTGKLLGAAVALAVTLPAFADTTIRFEDEKSGETGTAIMIKGNMVRMNSRDGNGFTLYDGGAGKMFYVNHKERSYMTIDKESMDQMNKQMEEAKKQMEAQLANVPESQRERMREMMSGMMDMGKEMLKPEVERTGKMLEKGGYTCEKVNFSVGRIAGSELCVVPFEELDIESGDAQAYRRMMDSMQAMTQQMTQNFGLEFDIDAVGGFAVYTRDRNEESGEVLGGISDESIAASEFEIPDGYNEERLGGE